LLLRALRALGHNPGAELAYATPREVLNWGIAHWDAGLIPRTLNLPEAQLQ
jgi:glutamyl-Q tRNA(Asp) synthetase